MTGQDIVEEARKWLGVPFRHAGRARSGIDCVGLPILVMHGLGVTEWDDTDYSRDVVPERMQAEIELFCEKVGDGPAAVGDGRPGDLLWFSIARRPTHAGILVVYPGGGTGIIHAWETVGKVMEHRLDDRWLARVESVYRLRGVD